ncbi:MULTISPECIES: DnaJ C-terminal domain-containing protein [unclassified Arthrobacter]|uniref:DnaJ C-terminal domain-containing protein n=1 Tax=unclassified Arthrobacter TaxID=235627 RepID=UPI001D14FD1A|nr:MULTISPECIES: DnaJ C-terminal domain-containing protein [unclassified Arthrobacter]MCC3290021.1 DnaJ domain-containing protein [Arthrobacter sp. zg-Y1110]MCC3300467.1 DnaJ domain-containing protein [Arthrobacter sp. zg-Y895]UWX84579.1 DnaJ domain-containing protein [Arthrobacter sp. zg-Y1110]
MASQDWVDKDFYKILGVPKDASDADIKKAYRKLARKYHPDQNQGDANSERMFKDLSEAYSVLSDAEERQQYDAIRAMGSGARFTAGGPQGAGGGAGGAGFEDIFGDLFGQTARGGGRRTTFNAGGSNIPPEFADLFGGGSGFGGGGFGAPPPTKGADRTASTTISFAGSINGTVIGLREPSGEVVEVRVPAGVKDGQKIRVRGKGQPGPAGAGDLMVTVHVTPHDFFTREGNNIRIHVPVSFPEAALGATIEVPTLTSDTVRLKVPAGTPSGRTLRVKGRGVHTSKGNGDLLVTIDVAVPTHLNKDAREAVEAFADATKGEDPRAGLAAKARL